MRNMQCYSQLVNIWDDVLDYVASDPLTTVLITAQCCGIVGNILSLVVITETYTGTIPFSRQYFEGKVNSTELKILCHVDPLLGSDRKISSYRIAVAKQWFCKQRSLLGSNHLGVPTDANTTEERRFLRGSCRDVNRTSLEFSKSVEWSELVAE